MDITRDAGAGLRAGGASGGGLGGGDVTRGSLDSLAPPPPTTQPPTAGAGSGNRERLRSLVALKERELAEINELRIASLEEELEAKVWRKPGLGLLDFGRRTNAGSTRPSLPRRPPRSTRRKTTCSASVPTSSTTCT